MALKAEKLHDHGPRPERELALKPEPARVLSLEIERVHLELS